MIPIRHYPTIDSTNLEAHRLFAEGERGPLFLVADEQTAGKGRLDRSWVSVKGNCYSTLILPLNRHSGESRSLSETELQKIPAFAGMTTIGLESTPQIGFVVALAVAEVVRGIANTKSFLKWPNDVLVNGAKIAGILCEILSTNPLTIGIGCGINVAHAPTGLAYLTTCLAAEGATTTRDQVFQSYVSALTYWLQMWNQGQNFAAIRSAWMQSAIGIGETITMRNADQHLTGAFEGLTEQGAVILKPPHGPPFIVYAGDMHIPSLAALRNGTS
jgi:BirA family transcriptional regulator, biotin operon repressor / biotin---[acetyl-CoA-carboxylase] ligase